MRRLGWIPLLLGTCLTATPLALADRSADRAYVDAVLDGLARAGVLTPEQARQIKEDAAQAAEPTPVATRKAWYDTLKISGYAQARWLYYPDADPDDPDNEFMVRGARLKLAASPTDRTTIEIQADFGEGDVTIKDAWIEQQLGGAGEFRLRAGQQKVPFGFETPQSSSVRIPLERNWVTRRMVSGEHDTGLVLFWTDPRDAERFSYAKKNCWGTGDYGTVSLGVYNGQGIDDGAEMNDGKHWTVRAAKPFMLDDDWYAEGGVSYYAGEFYSAAAQQDFDEDLLGAHFFLDPRPVGIQAEWYTGETEGGDVDGWYAMGMWRPNDKGVAFARYDEYDGPRKGQGIGNVYDRERWGFGYAHALDDKTELTIEYDIENVAGGGSNDLFGLQVQASY